MPELDPTRRIRFTASNAVTLLAGKADAIQNLYLTKIGDPRAVDDGFSDTWPAKFGLLVEPFALDWYALKYKCEMVDRGVQHFHPERDWVSATLDSRIVSRNGVPCNTVCDCKTIHPFRDIDEARSYYLPQLILQQECAKADETSLLVVKGGAEPVEIDSYIDENYRAVVWETIDRFWYCVETLTPPFPLNFPKVVAPDRWRSIDLDKDADLPNWSGEMRELLTKWDETHDTADAHEQAKTAIKVMFPQDCGKLTCGRLKVSRAINNAITIRRMKE